MVSTILCVSRPQACISPWRTSSFPKQEESCPPSSTLVHPRPTFGTHAPPVYLFDQLLLSCRSADHVSCAVATPLIDEQHTTRHDRHRKQIDTVEKARAGDPPTARSQMPPLILNESRAIITQLCPSPRPPSLPFAPLRSPSLPFAPPTTLRMLVLRKLLEHLLQGRLRHRVIQNVEALPVILEKGEE